MTPEEICFLTRALPHGAASRAVAAAQHADAYWLQARVEGAKVDNIRPARIAAVEVSLIFDGALRHLQHHHLR